jgi:DNA-directed RNA polymerase subunit RPC12/RpoP
MIRFCCENCGHKMSVQDKNAGRRGKCPKCGNFFVVPDKSATVEFRCKSCGQKISVPRIHAGKKGRCPKCKNPIVIPAVKMPVYKPEQNNSVDTTPRLAGNDAGLTLLEVPEEYKLKDEPVSETSMAEKANEQEQESKEESEAEETELTGRRRLPWLIDIFLYPTSASGFTHLGIFTVIPLIIAIFRALLGQIGLVVGLLGFLVNLALGLYLCWYVAECVRDSANGGLRAPEAFASMGLGDMWSQARHYIGCYLIFLGPAFFYSLYTQKTDTIFWFLLAYGVFFFPMGLLACVMFDSVSALNPVLLIGSIFSTFFQYCGLLLLIMIIVLAVRSLLGIVETENMEQVRVAMLMLGSVFYFILLYIFFVVAHLLGRFYWRYQDKLNWEV